MVRHKEIDWVNCLLMDDIIMCRVTESTGYSIFFREL